MTRSWIGVRISSFTNSYRSSHLKLHVCFFRESEGDSLVIEPVLQRLFRQLTSVIYLCVVAFGIVPADVCSLG